MGNLGYLDSITLSDENAEQLAKMLKDAFKDSVNLGNYSISSVEYEGGTKGATWVVHTDKIMATGGIIKSGDSTIGDNSHVMPINEGDEKMTKALFEVFIIDLDGDILYNDVVVAKNEEDAKFKLGIHTILAAYGVMSLDEVNILCRSLGTVRVNTEE